MIGEEVRVKVRVTVKGRMSGCCCCCTRWESLKPLNSCFAGVAARLVAIVAEMCDGAVGLIVWYCGICRERRESRGGSKALPIVSAEL
jgi:hypothetical protein